jgi:predicted MFS family arabinose efflux permease
MMTALKRFVPSLTRDQWLMFSATLLAGIGDNLWLNLQPLYIKFLGAQPVQIGATLSLAGILVIFLYIPSGMLADRGRYKALILTAWAITVVAMAWLAVAPDWRWAIPGFALYFVSTFARPALSGYIAAGDHGGNLSRTFAYVFSGYWIGSLLSPALGGWIAEHVGLRVVFGCAAGIYLLSMLVIGLLSNVPPPARVREARLGRLLTDRVFLWQLFIFMLIFFSMDVGGVLAPNFLQDVKGLNLEQIGALGGAASLGAILLNLWIARMHAGRRTSLLLAHVTVMIGLILLIGVPARSSSALVYGVLLAAYFFRGGINAAWTITSGRLGHWLEADVLSLGFGFRDTVSRIALTLSPFVAGQLYTRGPALPLYFGLLALGLTMAMTLTLPRHRAIFTAAYAESAENSK